MLLPVLVGGNRASELISSTAHHGNGSPLSRILSRLVQLDITGKIYDKDPLRDGHGGYSDIFIGRVAPGCLPGRHIFCVRDGSVKVAIKTLRVRLNQDVTLAKSLAREMAVWSKLNHPNILPFLGYMFEKDYPSLVSEWMDHGTVREFLRKNPGCNITRLALGIAAGLQYMHGLGVVHSDIKADNILIGPSGTPLICDFGISRMLDSSQSRFVSTTHGDNVKGSARWMAKELHRSIGDGGSKHTKETDVWAYGMTLFELISKELPYAHLRQDIHVVLAVYGGELPRFPDFSGSGDQLRYSFPGLQEICELCWAERAKERPTMSQIMQTLRSFPDDATGYSSPHESPLRLFLGGSPESDSDNELSPNTHDDFASILEYSQMPRAPQVQQDQGEAYRYLNTYRGMPTTPSESPHVTGYPMVLSSQAQGQHTSRSNQHQQSHFSQYLPPFDYDNWGISTRNEAAMQLYGASASGTTSGLEQDHTLSYDGPTISGSGVSGAGGSTSDLFFDRWSSSWIDSLGRSYAGNTSGMQNVYPAQAFGPSGQEILSPQNDINNAWNTLMAQYING